MPISFVMGQSRAAPKRKLSMAHLEFCHAFLGTQLSTLVLKELMINITNTFVLERLCDSPQLAKI